jgi:ComF family protein
LPARFLALLFPEDCRLCDRPLEEFSKLPVCTDCLDQLKPYSADVFCERCGTAFTNGYPLDAEGICRLCRSGKVHFDASYAYGSYEGELRQLVHLLKYGRVETAAPLLASRMKAALPPGTYWDLIVPVPLPWFRKWRRGFNQAELLGRELAKRTSIPFQHALVRRRLGRVQAGLTKTERRRNIANAFRNSPDAGVSGKSVLLVDDVFTTGATANACARLLKRSGAERGGGLTVARVDRRAPAAIHDEVAV